MRIAEGAARLVATSLAMAVVIAGRAEAQATEAPARPATAASTVAAAKPSPPVITGPVFVPGDSIQSPMNPAGNRAPTLPELSAADVAALQLAVAALPRFPAYLYSGCDDRAHATYRLLPDSLRKMAQKIWVFSPSKYTSALRGTLGIREPGPGSAAAPIRWGYHVALAFRGGGDSLLVYDAVLAPDRLLTRDEWFGLMTIPPASFWTLLPGTGYAFNGAVAAGEPKNNPGGSPNFQPFNGYVFTDNMNRDRILRNLARDEVGEAILKGTACQTLKASVASAGVLLDILKNRQAPADCMALHKGAYDRWAALLPAF